MKPVNPENLFSNLEILCCKMGGKKLKRSIILCVPPPALVVARVSCQTSACPRALGIIEPGRLVPDLVHWRILAVNRVS